MTSLKPSNFAPQEVVIVRLIDAPLIDVWQAWADASILRKWWGSKHCFCTYVTIHFTPGGKYFANRRSTEGTTWWSTGEYKEIVSRRKIVMSDRFADRHGNVLTARQAGWDASWEHQRLITLEFSEHSEQTFLKLRHSGIPANKHQACIQCWEEALDKLETVLRSPL